MSERKAKRQRRAERKATKPQQQTTSQAHIETTPPTPEQSSPVASSHLAIALSAAIPLRVLGLYERQGPDEQDLDIARETGTLLATKGDVLLFGSKVKGETAAVFNQTAEAIAVLSFAPGGITCFGQHFDAHKILSGFFGAETATQYCQQVTGTPPAEQQEQTSPHDGDRC